VEWERANSPVMSLNEAAAYLHVSKAHLSNLINGKVPGVTPIRVRRAGRRVLIKRDWIDEWLEATARKAATEC
jgi:excisionase family DNA binding protein